MKTLLRLSLLVAIGLMGFSECSLYAQEDSSLDLELQLIEELEDQEDDDDDEGIKIKGTIEIDGKQIHLDGEEIEAWLEANGEELEEWAEKHAEAWEEWAEQFGEKMERWAEEHESQWESWADEYSQRWEEWGSKLEAGEINGEEMGVLIERNLEMLKEMPLDKLIEGALHEGLGELKHAPFESLGELHELIGGALEQSLRNMENEIAGATKSELHGKLRKLKTDDLHVTLTKLQDALDAKQKKHHLDATDQVVKLKRLLEEENGLSEATKADVLAALKKKLTYQNARNAKVAKESAKQAQLLAKVLAKQGQDLDQKAAIQHEALRQAAEAKKIAEYMELQQQDLLATQKELESNKRSLERHYSNLKKQKAELGSNESEIEAMRREIRKLREEVERMRKQKRKNDD